MRTLEEFYEILGERDYALLSGKSLSLEEYMPLMSIDSIEKKYSGKIRNFLLHNVLVDEFNGIYNRYLSKLMLQPLYKDYLFVSYIELVSKIQEYKILSDIEQNRDDILEKMILDFEELKKSYVNLYQKYLGMTYIKYYEQINKINFKSGVEEGYSFLERTRKTYNILLSEIKKRYFGRQKNVFKVHLLSLFWNGLEEEINEESFQAIIGRLNIRKYKNLIIERKNIRGMEKSACCIPVKIPDDIRVIIPEKNNIMVLKSLMHEIGHALAFSHIDKQLDTEDKWLYNEVVQEAYALLFEQLIYEEDFQEWCGIEFPEKKQLLLKFYNIYQKRLTAAKTIFQYKMWKETDIIKTLYFYENLMSDTLGVHVKMVKGIMDVDFERPSIQYLIGLNLAEQIHKNLTFSYGKQWYKNEKSFEGLRRLWQKGGKITPQNIGEYASFNTREVL